MLIGVVTGHSADALLAFDEWLCPCPPCGVEDL